MDMLLFFESKRVAKGHLLIWNQQWSRRPENIWHTQMRVIHDMPLQKNLDPNSELWKTNLLSLKSSNLHVRKYFTNKPKYGLLCIYHVNLVTHAGFDHANHLKKA